MTRRGLLLYSGPTRASHGGLTIGVRTRLCVALGVAMLAGGCGTPSYDPLSVLRAAKASVDAASSFHFTLTSSDVAGSGPLLTGGSGVVARPASVSGTLSVTFSGLGVSVDIVSVGGTFYVRLPTSSGFSIANPHDYGFADPAELIDPEHGLSSLLTRCMSAHAQDDDRLNGEALHEIACTLPGTAVAALLVSADASQGVAATIGIDSGDNQLRRVVLTGPFFSKTSPSTFTVVLDGYGTNVTVTPPPTSG